MILITGASRGIGNYLMNKFLDSDILVNGTYNTSVPINSDLSFYSKVDISNYIEVKNWIDEKTLGVNEIIVINCAGTNYNSYAHKSNIEKWKRVIDVNLIGTFNVINSVLPRMRENKFGRIINFSSIVAQKGIPGTSAYAASKSGLWGLAKSIAVENASEGITINNLNLGYFDIGMISDVPDEYLKVIKKEIPKGELGDPENIYSAVKFLIENDYMTGSSIDINAGLY